MEKERDRRLDVLMTVAGMEYPLHTDKCAKTTIHGQGVRVNPEP